MVPVVLLWREISEGNGRCVGTGNPHLLMRSRSRESQLVSSKMGSRLPRRRYLLCCPCQAMLLHVPPSLMLVSTLLLGWTEAFGIPPSCGIFVPQCQIGVPPPARRPSSFLGWRSPDRCAVGVGLPHRFPWHAHFNEDIFRRRERRSVSLRSKQNDDQIDTSTNTKTYTQIDDGSPLGVAIVVLGGIWVALGDGQDMFLPFGMMGGVGGSYDGSTTGDVRIWAVFATASIAAGISRLVRYYRDKNIGE